LPPGEIDRGAETLLRFGNVRRVMRQQQLTFDVMQPRTAELLPGLRPRAVLDKLPKIETHEHDPIEAAEQIIAAMPDRPEIQHAGPKAFYSPITDRITLPPRELFASAEEYYATALHETVHSTGSQKRLAREGICEAAALGSALYSKEELCAEMGAAYLCAEAGISTAVIENQAAVRREVA
jgi:antirestriction protein ArdC